MPTEFQQIQKTLRDPPPLKEDLPLAAIIKRHMLETPVGDAAKTKAKINKCEAQLELGDLGGAIRASVMGTAWKKLVSLDKELSKVERYAPTAAVVACQLRPAKEKYCEAERERVAKAEEGA